MSTPDYHGVTIPDTHGATTPDTHGVTTPDTHGATIPDSHEATASTSCWSNLLGVETGVPGEHQKLLINFITSNCIENTTRSSIKVAYN
jgi:hypothetical protein